MNDSPSEERRSTHGWRAPDVARHLFLRTHAAPHAARSLRLAAATRAQVSEGLHKKSLGRFGRPTDANLPQPGRLSWPEQRKRAEEGERILPRVFQASADCCRDLAEREESSAAAPNGVPNPAIGTGAIRTARRKLKPSASGESLKPHLPLAVHESIAEIDGRTRRLLKGCCNIAPNGRRLSFNVEKAIRNSASLRFGRIR